MVDNLNDFPIHVPRKCMPLYFLTLLRDSRYGPCRTTPHGLGTQRCGFSSTACITHRRQLGATRSTVVPRSHSGSDVVSYAPRVRPHHRPPPTATHTIRLSCCSINTSFVHLRCARSEDPYAGRTSIKKCLRLLTPVSRSSPLALRRRVRLSTLLLARTCGAESSPSLRRTPPAEALPRRPSPFLKCLKSSDLGTREGVLGIGKVVSNAPHSPPPLALTSPASHASRTRDKEE
ncbi:hypothetical protein EJ02DRAFT_40313 [Clathrospora elynae]|uniref:Uncharacterized protein n=1 Tax=Clathrospora elynae TaxID=706981 RepID=A0A6A5SE10_9PLEO|nr:hypothetical protein EJ02DRAFT_40313 [Clathrospora elynae]